MSVIHPGLQLLSVLITLLLGLLIWGFWRYREYQKKDVIIAWDDAVLIGFLLFAAFVLGVFWTYFSFRFVP